MQQQKKHFCAKGKYASGWNHHTSKKGHEKRGKVDLSCPHQIRVETYPCPMEMAMWVNKLLIGTSGSPDVAGQRRIHHAQQQQPLHPCPHHHRYRQCWPSCSPKVTGGVAGRRGGVLCGWGADGQHTGGAGSMVSSGGSNSCLLDGNTSIAC
jgi:hypothetical protein